MRQGGIRRTVVHYLVVITIGLVMAYPLIWLLARSSPD